MPRRKPQKYSRKYCKQLSRGLRKDGKSIVEICQLWDIAEKTYYLWIKEHGEFAEAHEIGKRDEQAYWHRLCRKAAEGEIKTNGTILKVAASVMLGWNEKVPEDTAPRNVTNILVEVAEPREAVVTLLERLNNSRLAHVVEENIIDAESD